MPVVALADVVAAALKRDVHGVTRVIGMNIQSANDAADRDPKTVILEGSNDPQIGGFNNATNTIPPAPITNGMILQIHQYVDRSATFVNRALGWSVILRRLQGTLQGTSYSVTDSSTHTGGSSTAQSTAADGDPSSSASTYLSTRATAT